jgi:hypothetical protein
MKAFNRNDVSPLKSSKSSAKADHFSWHPVSDEHIDLVWCFSIAIRDKHQLLPVRRELWKRAEATSEGDALKRFCRDKNGRAKKG